MVTFDPLKFTLPLLLFTVTACTSNPPASNTPASEPVVTALPVEAVLARFGSSHGMCVGYCTHEYELKGNGLVARRKGGGRGDPSTHPADQEQFLALDKATIDAAMASMDAAAFDAAPDVIGCPDCADGGRCWVEVVRDGKPRTITFDCSTGSEKLKAFTDRLWELAGKVKWPEN